MVECCREIFVWWRKPNGSPYVTSPYVRIRVSNPPPHLYYLWYKVQGEIGSGFKKAGSRQQQFVGEYQRSMSLPAHKSVDIGPFPRISECSYLAYYPAVSSSKKHQHVVAISRGDLYLCGFFMRTVRGVGRNLDKGGYKWTREARDFFWTTPPR